MHVPSRLRKKIEWLFRRAEGALLPDALLAAEGAHLDPDGARLALRAAADDVAVVGHAERLERLGRALTDDAARAAYVREHGACGVRRFDAGTARIYQLSVETFPRHVNNVYLILDGAHALLVDCGSGLPSSQRDLALGFAVVRAAFSEDARWEELSLCLVSHAHIDHFGGANHLARTSRAEIVAHELDARVLTAFEERFADASRALSEFWRRAGVEPALRASLLETYAGAKRLFVSEPGVRALADGDVIGPGYVVHHVPGHCPGLVCLKVHDVLLTSDHVLARITPHQFPRSIAPFAGLDHYFRSLAKIRALEGVSLALGGHEEPIVDLRARIDEIAAFHRARLARALAACASPRTVEEVSAELFPGQEGYGVILALDEAGAHLEALALEGRVSEDEDASGVVRYAAR